MPEPAAPDCRRSATETRGGRQHSKHRSTLEVHRRVGYPHGCPHFTNDKWKRLVSLPPRGGGSGWGGERRLASHPHPSLPHQSTGKESILEIRSAHFVRSGKTVPLDPWAHATRHIRTHYSPGASGRNRSTTSIGH